MIRRAKDGLPARVSGSWTQEKLAYLERYARAFMTAMGPKRTPGTAGFLLSNCYLS